MNDFGYSFVFDYPLHLKLTTSPVDSSRRKHATFQIPPTLFDKHIKHPSHTSQLGVHPKNKKPSVHWHRIMTQPPPSRYGSPDAATNKPGSEVVKYAPGHGTLFARLPNHRNPVGGVATFSVKCRFFFNHFLFYQ